MENFCGNIGPTLCRWHYITQSNVVYNILQICMLYWPNDGKVLPCWLNWYQSNSRPMCAQQDISPTFTLWAKWYRPNNEMIVKQYPSYDGLNIGLLTRGRNCGMLEWSSLVRPFGIIILASLQKDFDSLLTNDWTLLTAKRLAGYHIVPYFVHV